MIQHLARPVFAVDVDGRAGYAHDGAAAFGELSEHDGNALPLLGFAPVLLPQQLGDPAFRLAHGVKLNYVAGAMANGIGSVDLVAAMARAGMLGFFGAAGLPVERVASAIDELRELLGDAPFGMNLIHSPNEPQLEAAIVDLYLKRGVRLVSASAYLDLTLPLVRYRLNGIARQDDGAIVTPNRVIAKVSRVEVARKFFAPAPDEILRELVRIGELTPPQAEWAALVPLAEDLTAEADSGGHTDNRPALTLLPTMITLRDEIQSQVGFARLTRVGLAGGVATPAATAAAFAMGAAYVLTGSINQACVEAGTSAAVREMLAAAQQADVIMAPAADMFEMGVNVQVLKRGTMFALRARKLYELYRSYGSIEDLPAAQRGLLERDLFRQSLDEAWADTRRFFEQRDPAQIERAERDSKHKLALLFRSYLGRSSNWANEGVADRRMDYQIWCGPAMGAFNEWTRGSLLEQAAKRDVVTVAENLMVGAGALTRAAWLRNQGVRVPTEALHFAPRDRQALRRLCARSGKEV